MRLLGAGASASTDQTGVVSSIDMKARIRRYVAGLDSYDLVSSSESAFDVTVLPMVLYEVANVHLPMAELKQIISTICDAANEVSHSRRNDGRHRKRRRDAGDAAELGTVLVPMVGSSSDACAPAPLAVVEWSRYEEFSKDECVVLLSRKDDTIDKLRDELKTMTRLALYREDRCCKLEDKVQDTSLQLAELTAKVNFRPGTTYCSLLGGYHMGLKGALGSGAGAGAVVSMVAGESQQGSFKDKHILYTLQQRIHTAQLLTAAKDYMAQAASTFIIVVADAHSAGIVAWAKVIVIP